MSDTSATVKKGQFSIGEFSFDTFHEYRAGQEDLRKIEAINEELDVHDPEVAVRLYNMIRSGEIAFKTAIGDDFSAHVADIVADRSKGFMDGEQAVEEARAQVRVQLIAGVISAVLAVALFAYFGIVQVSEWNSARKLSKLRDTVGEEGTTEAGGDKLVDESTGELRKEEGANSAGNTASSGEVDPFARGELIDPSTLEILPEYQAAFDENNELVGWLTIPDTAIDYPVVQKADDNEYYLSHAFDNTPDTAGTLFVDYRSDITNPTTNTIIYGHNMHNKTMFGTVSDYLDRNFFETHKRVQFNTIFEKREYEIVAVCLAEVIYQDENSYRYYNFIQASNQAEGAAFVAKVKALSVFGEDIDLVKTDEILTLSTCNDYVQDGRLFLVARRLPGVVSNN
ncbi:MAG: class B sortase [Lachnospiraceae bacterium]|nr:class B sortase [Lachnospiraceae bacterium]